MMHVEGIKIRRTRRGFQIYRELGFDEFFEKE